MAKVCTILSFSNKDSLAFCHPRPNGAKNMSCRYPSIAKLRSLKVHDHDNNTVSESDHLKRLIWFDFSACGRYFGSRHLACGHKRTVCPGQVLHYLVDSSIILFLGLRDALRHVSPYFFHKSSTLVVYILCVFVCEKGRLRLNLLVC